MAAPYKWYRPDASAGGDGDSYATAYDNINTAFAALSATYYILNIVPTLSGVIPSAPIVLNGLKGAPTTFMPKIRITNSAGDPLPMADRFTLDGNATLLNVLQIINCDFVEFTGLRFDRATQDNIQGLTTASTWLLFTDCDSVRAGRHGSHSIVQSSTYWKYNRGVYSNNVGRAITNTGTLNISVLHGLDIKNNGGDVQVAVPANSSVSKCIFSNGLTGIVVNSLGSIVNNCIFDNFSVSAISNTNGWNTHYDLLIKNTPIGIVGATSAYDLDNVTYYNVTNPRTTTTGKPRIGRETILDYDPTDANYNQYAKVPTRRKIFDRGGFLYGETAGIPGADIIYPLIGSVSPNVGSVDGGTEITITLPNGGATGKTAGTVKGVALTHFVVVSDTTITARTGAMTAGQGDVAITGIDGVLTGGFTAQAANAPEAFTIAVTAWATNSVKVEWGASAGAVSYRVYRDNIDISGELKNISKWIDENATSGTYAYKVIATNSVGTRTSNILTFTKGVGGISTIYNLLLAIYRAIFNTQKIIKVGATHYLVTYDDDDVTVLGMCALKTFEGNDIADLTGTVTPSQRLRSIVGATGAAITGKTVADLSTLLFKKEFHTRKNEEVIVGSGIVSEVVYDTDDVTKISAQELKTYSGGNLPSQLNTTTASQRKKSTI
jgi:hypothetical protein